MTKKRTCYKCGKEGIAKIEPTDEEYTEEDIEMVKQGGGRHRGEHICKDCMN